MKVRRRDYFLFLSLFLSLPSVSINSQKVYTQLKKAKEVQSFTEVSRSLVCQCGCNFLLSVCPHVECPWGIPVRVLIEKRILSGHISHEIVQSFKEGFGNSLADENASYVQMLQNSERYKLLSELKKGYTQKISARNSLLFPFLFVSCIFIIAIFLLLYWFRKNRIPNKEI